MSTGTGQSSLTTKRQWRWSFSTTNTGQKEKVERRRVTDVIKTVLQRPPSKTDQGRVLHYLRREFPCAFDRFVRDNGGRVPHIPLYRSPSMVARRPLLNEESKDERSGPDALLETEAAMNTLYGVLPGSERGLPVPPERVHEEVASDMWSLFSGVFCFSPSAKYMPEEEEGATSLNPQADNSVVRGETGIAAALNPLNINPLNMNPLTMLAPSPSSATGRNPLAFQPRPGANYRVDREALVQDLANEAHRILLLYVGVTRERGVTFNWTLKKSADNIYVHNCDVRGCNFSALKSDCMIKRDKYTILKYITDDDKGKVYDDTLEGYTLLQVVNEQTRIRRYFYHGIWPCSPRDFILLTTWQELEDGSLLVSTISPPDELYPEYAGYVRATVLISGAHIRPIAANLGGGCNVTIIGHSDLRGQIPSIVINQLATGIPHKFVKKLKEAIEKAPR